MLGRGVHRRTRCAPAALRSDNCGESVHEAWALRRPCHPAPCAPQAHPEGTRESNIHTGHCFARPRLTGASASRCATWAERSNGPWGCSAVGCLVAHPPSGCACGGAVVGWHARRSARASCSSSPWLSERRAKRKASSTAHPAIAPTQVCSVAQRRGRRLRVAFLLGTFLWRSKEKYLARRGDNPAPAIQSGMPPIREPASAPGFKKLKPNIW